MLEYADAGTLAERVALLRGRGWCPGADDVLAVAQALAAAVDALHDADVVHRDLSPGNVLLRTDRTAREGAPGRSQVTAEARLLLADLGLCKDLAVNSGLTAAAGTEGFRPPEQRHGPAVVDPAADLWALSALMVWLVTGRPPPGGPVRQAVAGAGLPTELGAVLDEGLAEPPAARQADARTWLDAVERALAPVQPVPLSPTARAGRAQEHGPAAVAAGRRPGRAAAAVAGLAAGALLAWGSTVVGGGPEVTSLDGGDVRIARSGDGVTVAIVGPEEGTVGEAVTFTADLSAVDEWVWVGSDGVVHAGAPRLEVRTSSPGVASVTLIGVAPSGEPIEVTHDLRVTDD